MNNSPDITPSSDLKGKLIVFDWNGTVIADTIPAWKASNACLEYFGKAPISLEKFKDTFTFPVIHFYVKNGCTTDEILARKDESNTIFQSTYEMLAANVRTRAGIRTVLEELNAAGAHCMVLSNYLTNKIAAHVDRLGLGHYFQYICAHNCDGSTILQSTSKLERLQHYMDQNGFEPRNTVIIGDSMEEPEIARLLGITSISITGGCVSESRLKRTKPDFLVHSLSAAGHIIKENL